MNALCFDTQSKILRNIWFQAFNNIGIIFGQQEIKQYGNLFLFLFN